MTKVNLADIIEQFELASESNKSYLNRNTGEIHLIPEEVEMYFDNEEFDENDLPEWEKEIIRIEKDIQENPENYIQFPDQYEINEYSIMENFSLSLTNKNIRELVYSSLKGKGAFRKFKDTVNKYGIMDEWYKFRDESIRELAIEWCEENNLQYD